MSGENLSVMEYIGLGIALGLLTGWAFLASRFHTKLSKSGTLGQKTTAVVNNIVTILSAVAAGFIAFSLMIADRNYSGMRLILLIVIWLATSLAVTLWRRRKVQLVGDTTAQA